MRYNILKYSTVLLLGFGLTGIQAQESILATGGNAIGSGGSASYSVGQVVYTTNKGVYSSEAQGVQQPYEISLVLGLEEAKYINMVVLAYPNPITDYLKLSVDNFDVSTLSFQLQDMNGKLFEHKKIEDNPMNIIVSNLVSGTYFLTVLQGNKNVKTFKIIKN